MKSIAYHLFILFLLFTSCKPTSTIITSKDETLKKGIYVTPVAKNLSPKKEKQLITTEKKNEGAKKSKIIEVNEVDYLANTEDSSYLTEQLIHSATNKIGIRYKSGGITDEGYDCSGLMFTIFNLYHINLPHSSFDQAKLGVVIEKENAKKGDLIFFETNGRNRINHVGMVVEITDDEIKFIHSSTSSGVIISSTKEPYYQKSFVQINRVLE